MKNLIYVLLLLFGSLVQAQLNPTFVTAQIGDVSEQVTFTTTSILASWSPPTITNTGDVFNWVANGGGITEQEFDVNDPTFDFSANTGTVTITVTSTDSFVGFTSLGLNSLDITSASISNATSLIHLDLYESLFTSISLTTNVNLEDIWIQQSALTSFDVSDNDLATYVAVDNNSLNDTNLDGIINDLDANGESNGTLSILNNTGSLTSSAQPSYDDLITKGWTIDASAPSSPSNTTPQIFNFNIVDAQPSRIYFHSSETITASTVTGFKLGDDLGKTISSVTINGTSTTGHYFTVSSAFDFWDNNNIRYIGGSNIQDGSSNGVFDFTLQHITNNINEPTAATIRYVNTTGSGTQDGTSEANAWTLATAITSATAGTTVYCKAGNYGAGQWNFYQASSTKANPIKFIGYKTSTGDITSNYYTYDSGSTLNSAEMPTLDGSGASVIALIGFGGNSGLIVKNFQTINGSAAAGFTSNGGDGIMLENCNARGQTRGINFYSGSTNIIKDCISVNHTLHALQGSDTNSLYEGNKLYSDLTGGDTMDYYLTVLGGSYNNTYLNNTSKRGLTGDGWEHGFSLASEIADTSTHNLVEGQYVTGGAVSLELRHQGCSDNIVRGLISDGASIGIRLRDGAHDNIVENLFSDNCTNGIDFTATSEPVGAGDVGSSYRNIIKNSIIYNATYSVYCKATVVGFSGDIEDNEILNTTFYNDTKSGKLIHEQETEGITYTTNIMTNCIIQNIDVQGITTGWIFDYNNIYTSWSTSVGTNSSNIDSDFVDTTNFISQATTMTAPKITGVNYDKSNEERSSTTTKGALKSTTE